MSVLLDGLFRDRNFGSIEISRYEHLNHDTSTIGRLFENMMHLGRVSKHSNQDNKLHIKSTLERWSDVLKMYYPRDGGDLVYPLTTTIIGRIKDESQAIANRKKKSKRKQRRNEKKKTQTVGRRRKDVKRKLVSVKKVQLMCLKESLLWFELEIEMLTLVELKSIVIILKHCLRI